MSNSPPALAGGTASSVPTAHRSKRDSFRSLGQRASPRAGSFYDAALTPQLNLPASINGTDGRPAERLLTESPEEEHKPLGSESSPAGPEELEVDQLTPASARRVYASPDRVHQSQHRGTQSPSPPPLTPVSVAGSFGSYGRQSTRSFLVDRASGEASSDSDLSSTDSDSQDEAQTLVRPASLRGDVMTRSYSQAISPPSANLPRRPYANTISIPPAHANTIPLPPLHAHSANHEHIPRQAPDPRLYELAQEEGTSLTSPSESRRPSNATVMASGRRRQGSWDSAKAGRTPTLSPTWSRAASRAPSATYLHDGPHPHGAPGHIRTDSKNRRSISKPILTAPLDKEAFLFSRSSGLASDQHSSSSAGASSAHVGLARDSPVIIKPSSRWRKRANSHLSQLQGQERMRKPSDVDDGRPENDLLSPFGLGQVDALAQYAKQASSQRDDPSAQKSLRELINQVDLKGAMQLVSAQLTVQAAAEQDRGKSPAVKSLRGSVNSYASPSPPASMFSPAHSSVDAGQAGSELAHSATRLLGSARNRTHSPDGRSLDGVKQTKSSPKKGLLGSLIAKAKPDSASMLSRKKSSGDVWADRASTERRRSSTFGALSYPDRAMLSQPERDMEEAISRVHLELSSGTVARASDCAAYLELRFTQIFEPLDADEAVPSLPAVSRWRTRLAEIEAVYTAAGKSMASVLVKESRLGADHPQTRQMIAASKSSNEPNADANVRRAVSTVLGPTPPRKVRHRLLRPGPWEVYPDDIASYRASAGILPDALAPEPVVSQERSVSPGSSMKSPINGSVNSRPSSLRNGHSHHGRTRTTTGQNLSSIITSELLSKDRGPHSPVRSPMRSPLSSRPSSIRQKQSYRRSMLGHPQDLEVLSAAASPEVSDVEPGRKERARVLGSDSEGGYPDFLRSRFGRNRVHDTLQSGDETGSSSKRKHRRPRQSMWQLTFGRDSRAAVEMPVVTKQDVRHYRSASAWPQYGKTIKPTQASHDYSPEEVTHRRSLLDSVESALQIAAGLVPRLPTAMQEYLDAMKQLDRETRSTAAQDAVVEYDLPSLPADVIDLLPRPRGAPDERDRASPAVQLASKAEAHAPIDAIAALRTALGDVFATVDHAHEEIEDIRGFQELIRQDIQQTVDECDTIQSTINNADEQHVCYVELYYVRMS
ncbi:uncharacterized protein L969DRAFT_116708 [Mixia osmundae IAM 14324]|uniref:uncharacterized protein n=1 Tax=Mixia osmundae (strain CBS 9802 / IAM 14324 / JCM 22182 / KY 12970) TaxID=764103 RepID=UPI0004A54F09|nr:uncharacterized protein L969DRAFT_116708 [Mixia osmundae IAM 14324]KEI41884.1 hypothetical protein L969DRAFT_116708 [Mixia osmundae IAM 14324]